MEIFRHNLDLVVKLEDERGNDDHWLNHAIDERGGAVAGKAFDVDRSWMVHELSNSREVVFRIGTIEGAYWKMHKEVVGINYDLFLSVDCPWARKHFVAEKGVRIFPIFDRIVSDNLYIGGNNNEAFPFSGYDENIRKLPNYYELAAYVRGRASNAFKEYINVKGDAYKDYESLLEKRVRSSARYVPEELATIEVMKFDYLIKRMEELLADAESLSENQWQKEILIIIRLLFPKYIAVLEKIRTNDLEGNRREIDIGLLDVDGNIDIIEIKKPFDLCVMSRGTYRNNYIPLRELSGSIMQVEKYIFYLQRGGIASDEKITQQFQDKLPAGLKVKVVNPRGMIIMGRSHNLNKEQISDFEVVKRKYKSLTDVITYDDLLQRLKILKESISNAKYQ